MFHTLEKASVPATFSVGQPEVTVLGGLLAGFEAVTLAQVSQSLLERVDTKFLLDVNTLTVLLPNLAADYAVLDIAGERVFDYHNLYLDTPEFAFFKAHQRGAYSRHKVRYRHYQQTDDTFLELKTKSAKRYTHKTRQRVANVDERKGALLEQHLPKGLFLTPALRSPLPAHRPGKQAHRRALDLRPGAACRCARGKPKHLFGAHRHRRTQTAQAQLYQPFYEARSSPPPAAKRV